jgi:hypothetical protein
MAKTDPIELDALDRFGDGIKLVLAPIDDGFAHAVFGVIDGKSSPLLEIASAVPIQEVVEHTAPDGRRSLLLTGAGGGNYWSATVSTITDLHFALLGFDFACRKGRSAEEPGIDYLIARGITVQPHFEEGLLLSKGDRDFLLRAAEMPTSLSTEAVATCQLVRSGESLRIKPLNSPHVSTRSTVQWRYEISTLRKR